MKVWPSFERAKVAGICQFQKGYLMYFDVICMTPADMFDPRSTNQILALSLMSPMLKFPSAWRLQNGVSLTMISRDYNSKLRGIVHRQPSSVPDTFLGKS